MAIRGEPDPRNQLLIPSSKELNPSSIPLPFSLLALCGVSSIIFCTHHPISSNFLFTTNSRRVICVVLIVHHYFHDRLYRVRSATIITLHRPELRSTLLAFEVVADRKLTYCRYFASPPVSILRGGHSFNLTLRAREPESQTTSVYDRAWNHSTKLCSDRDVGGTYLRQHVHFQGPELVLVKSSQPKTIHRYALRLGISSHDSPLRP